MKCPKCGADSSVLESRVFEYETLRRRRECRSGHRFTTVEIYREIYGSARQRASVYAKSMARWRKIWGRNLDMVRNSHLGWQHFATKYSLSRSAVFLAARQMRAYLRKNKR